MATCGFDDDDEEECKIRPAKMVEEVEGDAPEGQKEAACASGSAVVLPFADQAQQRKARTNDYECMSVC